MPKTRTFKKIIITILICSTIFTLTGCDKKISDEELKKEKVDQELEFLDTKFISLMNLLNNMSFTDYKVATEDIKEEDKSDKSSSNNNSESSNSNKESSSSEEEKSSKSSSESSSGSSSNSSQQESNNKEKNQIFKLEEENILSLKSNSNIKWDLIKSDIENLYSIWATITIDLQNVGANNDDILQFNSLLDELAKSAKDENKQESLTILSKLYDLLPKYMSSYSKNDVKKSVFNTKAHLLKAYSIADSGEWGKMKEEILKANEEFSNVINNTTIDKNKKLNVNRAYILLKETRESE